MKFSWDETKARSNLSKHKTGFIAAASVFSDSQCAFVFDRIENGEERWHAYGRDDSGNVLVVVHSYRGVDDKGGDLIRIISARRATRTEVRKYEENN